jgi:long-chain acyl-CoA synthetase
MDAKEKSWFKVWPSNVPYNLVFPKIALHDLLIKTAQDHPNQLAIDYAGTEITYKELDLLSDQFAAGLTKLGIRKKDRIALFLPNIPQFIIAYFGILKVGAIVTTISPLYREREVKYQLINSGAKGILTIKSLYPIVEKIWRKTKLQKIIVTSSTWQFPNIDLSQMNVVCQENVLSFEQIIEANSDSTFLQVEINPKVDLAALQYTGGTTGRAKGAMLTHMNLVSNALMFANWIQAKTAYEKFLTALPLFHIYGMTTSMTVPISLAAKMVLTPKFDPKKILEIIQNKKITVFCGVPTMYSILLANKDIENYDLTSIRICISGASPLPPQVQKKFMTITKGFLAEGYGLTEASPVTHCNPIDKTLKTVRIGSIGIPLPDTDARIFDVTNHKKELPVGEKGELAIRGPQVMLGYWQNPIETALVLKNGWLLTGDIGKMDNDGFFYVTDRKKDLIKYKDYSVYPREIEDVIYENSNVKICAVIGKPVPIVGEIPKAFVVLKDESKVTEKEIMTFVNDKLAPYKAIREIEFRKNLPLSSVGKVLRRILQDEEKTKIKND